MGAEIAACCKDEGTLKGRLALCGLVQKKTDIGGSGEEGEEEEEEEEEESD